MLPICYRDFRFCSILPAGKTTYHALPPSHFADWSTTERMSRCITRPIKMQEAPTTSMRDMDCANLIRLFISSCSKPCRGTKCGHHLCRLFSSACHVPRLRLAFLGQSSVQCAAQRLEAFDLPGAETVQGEGGLVVRERFLEVRPFPAAFAVNGAGNRREFRQEDAQAPLMREVHGGFDLLPVGIRVADDDVGGDGLRARLAQVRYGIRELLRGQLAAGPLQPSGGRAFQSQEETAEADW